MENVLKNESGGFENLDLTECSIGTEKAVELLEKIINKNKNLKNLEISHKSIYKENVNINISNVKNVKLKN